MSKITDAFSPTGAKLSAFSDAVRQSREEVSRYAQAHPEVGKLSIAMRQLGANVPAIASMTTAYRNGVNSLQPFIVKHREAGVAAKTLAMETKSAGVFADAAARQMGNSMQVGVARMVAPIKGSAMAGFSLMKSGLAGVKSAASGLMGAFGGPWGVALAGAGILLAKQQAATAAAKAAHVNMAKAVRDAAAAQLDLQASLAGTTGELGEQGLAAAARIAKGEMSKFIEEGSRPLTLTESVDTTTVAVDQFINKIPGIANETQKANANSAVALRDMQSGYAALKQSAEDMGIPMEKLNDIVAKGGPEYDQLIAKLRESGPQANYAADQLENARAKVDGLVQAARNADGGFTTAATAIKTLADAGSSAEDKLTALETIMQALGLAPKNAEKAMMDAAKAVDGLADSATSSIDAAAGLGGAMLTLDGKLDPANANARALSDALGTMRQSLEKVAINGGDTAAAFKNMSPELEKLQQQFGLTDDQMQKLIRSNGLLPDKIDMAVGLQGADKVTQDLASLQIAIEAAPDKKDINVGVLDDNSAQKIRDIGFEVEKLPDGSTKVHVDDAEAKDKLLWLSQNGFPAIDVANPTAKVNLDDSGMLFKLEYAKMQLATLDLERPTPLANMDIGMLSGAQVEALNKVGLLNGQRPTPAAGMNISQLSEKQQTALAQVFDLGAKRPTPVGDMNIDPLTGKKREASGQVDALGRQRANPVANLNNDGVRRGADESKQWIGGIVGKTVTVTFRAIYEGFKDRLGIGGGYTGGQFSDSGHFARYATGGRHGGYRLPKSGPGTEVTDGFLAFDQNNVPAARLDAGEWVINSRSSEKYSKELAQINRGTFPKLPGYADGGRHLRHSDEIANFAKGLEGKPYVWGGVNWGDCSGAMAAIARFAVGLAPFAGRFATGNMRQALAQLGFRNGRGGPGDLRMGWFNGGPFGGHTAGTLPNGVNVEMGGRRGNGQYGGPAAGANDPSFTDHAYLRVPGGWKIGGVDGLDAFAIPGDKAYGKAGDSYTGGSVTGGGYSGDSAPSSWSDVAGVAASSWAKGQVQDILGVFGIPDTPPALAAYRQYQEEMKKGADSKPGAPSDSVQQSPGQKPPTLDWPESVNRTFEVKYNPGKGVEQWDSTVRMALKRTGFDLSNVRRTLDQIKIESNGNPNAQNNWDINAKNGDPSIGLLQVIGSTFRAFRDKALPNDQRHPLANVVAALNYVRNRYGSPAKIWPTRAGYKDGGYVRGPGGTRGDKIPAWLSDMEFVVNAASTANNLGLLKLINGGAPVEAMVGAALSSAKSVIDVAQKADWDSAVLSELLHAERGSVFSAGGSLVGADNGTVRESSEPQVVNTFIAANPEEMYRMYRRSNARDLHGKVGAR
ncbi:transglycosylase SLT domain-containing protein [Corynebacterium auriscanis]|uniref:transglycosylase SLT domain-containing protein n=1 Tax=Corynebacterium auriscanis TaxID=99807 RepID=UPI003CF1B281